MAKLCGANKSNGESCRNTAGRGTSHPGEGRCNRHGGASPNGNKAAARAAIMSMASEVDGDPHEVMLKAIRCDWGAVTYLGQKMATLAGENFVEIEEYVGPGGVMQERLVKTEMATTQRFYQQWVDQAARHSKMALDAGIAEKQVELNRSVAELLFAIMLPSLKAGDLTIDQERRIASEMTLQLERVSLSGDT